MSPQKKPRKPAPKPSKPKAAAAQGWKPQPSEPTAAQLVKRFAGFGVTRELLKAKAKLIEYMRSPETLERAAFERRGDPAKIGAECFAGVSIGPRVRKGKTGKQVCVVVKVKQKVRDKSRIADSVRLDKLKSEIGADIDVVEVAQPAVSSAVDWGTIILPGGNTDQQLDPPSCGCSVGPQGSGLTGTCGAVVFAGDGDKHILSNNHVLAGLVGTIQPDGISNGLPDGHPIQHVGRADDSGGAKPIALLASDTPSLRLSRFESNNMQVSLLDAALARCDPSGAVLPQLIEVGNIQPDPLPSGQITPGMRVQKVGRTTGLTHGIVSNDADHMTPAIGYQLNNGDKVFARFNNVFAVQSAGGGVFSDRGDSGSIILTDPDDEDEDPQAIGLLFAGNGQLTWFFPMDFVFEELNIIEFHRT
jgi:hypothetical protein